MRKNISSVLALALTPFLLVCEWSHEMREGALARV